MIVNGLINGLYAGLGQIKTAISSIGDASIDWFKEKLGIHSPSRVFAELGGFTMAGLAKGLEGGQKGPLDTLASMGKQLTAAGALALSATAMPALAVDDRPPLAASTATTTMSAPTEVTINVHAAPGMDEGAIAREVAKQVDRILRAKEVRQRSLLKDLE